MHKGDYDRAIADCNEAVKFDPNEFGAYQTRGYAYLGKGDYDRAISYFEHALKLYPDFERAKEGLAEAKRRRDTQEGQND